MPASPANFTVDRPSELELVVSRTYDAPARIVYEAFTRPEHMKRWWAPRSYGAVLYECTNDVRVGGKYRYVFGKEGEPRMAFSGEFREVVPAERLVATERFEQLPHAGEVLITTTFVEAHGRTTLRIHQRFPSVEAIEGAIASGMTGGMEITLQQLAELCAELL